LAIGDRRPRCPSSGSTRARPLVHVDAKLLFEGHVHSPSAKLVLGFVLLCGFAIAVAAAVVRQVFAVELYRASGADSSVAAA